MDGRRAYRALLRLFPGDYRSCFETEMLDAVECASEEWRARGAFAHARFVCLELLSLTASLPMEWIAKLTTSRSVRARSLPDLRMMRPAGVSRELWFAWAGASRSGLPDEVREAEKRVQLCLWRMEHAIATHDFPGARFYSNEDLKAREQLRLARTKYGLGE